MGKTRPRDGLARLLAIAGLSGLAIAQPLLDLLGGSPAIFQVNRIDRSGIIWFGIAVVVVPPAVLWVVGEGVFGSSRRVGRWLHLGFVGLLCGFIGVLAAKEVTVNALADGLVAVAFAVGGVMAYLRFAGFGTWVRLLSAANVLFLFQFVFLSPVSDWIREGTQEALEVDSVVVEGTAEQPASVVMLVLDELPTQSLLTEDETIDGVRFPNFSEFAEEATWYRHFSTVSPFTQSAVPALLDGLDPHGDPTWADHPESLFSLLAGSHNLVVSESLTQVCGFDECGVRPVAPPAPVDEEVVEPVVSDIETDSRWGRIIDRSWEVWTDRVTPGSPDPPVSFDDFQEEFTVVEQEPLRDANAGFDDDEVVLERFLATLVSAQPNRHRLFVDALRPTDEPFLGYLHLVLPHQPWTVREDGTLYEVEAGRIDFEADNDDAWPVLVSQQRHLLQAEYADRLLGLVLARLKEIGEYEDTLIIVVGDHGVAFEAGESSRSLSENNLEQIVYAPLLIRAPGQGVAVIDDTNVNSTDVTPTIADLLGIELPWETDGAPIGSSELENRGSGKYVYSFTDAFDYQFLGIVEYDDRSAFEDLMAGRFPAIDGDSDPLAGLYRGVAGGELIGRSSTAVFGPLEGDAEIAGLGRLLDPDPDEPLLGEIAGRVFDAPPGSSVVVAVNGRVVGVSPLYERSGEVDSFVVLLGGDVLSHDTNTVTLGLRRTDGTVTELALRDS